ncbi:MAG TPA: cytochrome b [Steroidobacteraceae bacterium]|jgi:cytochrome b561|nr:cytochrome b [Steroidobacteraceae bacterium]
MNVAETRLARASTILTEPAARYDNFSILLHWATAALIILLWVIAQVIDDFARGAPRMMVRSVHIALGVTLAVVIAARLAWRASPRRRAPLAEAGLLGTAARIMHYGLYVLVIATIALGIANVWTRGDTIFGLFTVPKLSPGNTGLKEAVEEVHEWFGNALLIVAALHAAAGLFHRFVLKDEVLQRMLPLRVRR